MENLPTIFQFLTLPAVFLATAVLCWLIVARRDWFVDKVHMTEDVDAPQAQHESPTPRIGGAVIILVIFIWGLFSYRSLGPDLALALLSGVVVFMAGIREDLCRDVSPLARLIAAFVSAGLAVALTGYSISAMGIAGIDYILSFWAVSLVFTLIWAAGYCNALNIIDGLNGLSSGYIIAVCIGLSVISGYTGDLDLRMLLLVVASVVSGFLVVNWPMGKIFMGDAGAYAAGHILAWAGIILIVRNSDITGLAILLLLFWPVADTALSIARRMFTNAATGMPDSQHFHHQAAGTVRLMTGNRLSRRAQNSLTGLLLLPFYTVPVVAGVVYRNQPIAALACLMLFSLLFLASYFLLKRIADSRTAAV